MKNIKMNPTAVEIDEALEIIESLPVLPADTTVGHSFLREIGYTLKIPAGVISASNCCDLCLLIQKRIEYLLLEREVFTCHQKSKTAK